VLSLEGEGWFEAGKVANLADVYVNNFEGTKYCGNVVAEPVESGSRPKHFRFGRRYSSQSGGRPVGMGQAQVSIGDGRRAAQSAAVSRYNPVGIGGTGVQNQGLRV
jgi:hypothetical protein